MITFLVGVLVGGAIASAIVVALHVRDARRRRGGVVMLPSANVLRLVRGGRP